MSGKKISELPVAIVTGDDLIPLVDNPSGTAITGTATVDALRRHLAGGTEIFRQTAKPTLRSNGLPLEAGDRWLHTGDYTWWLWNGSQWLSEQIYTAITTLAVQAGTVGWGHFDIPSNFNLQLLRFSVAGVTTTAHTATVRWRIILESRTAAAETPIATITLDSQPANTRYRVENAINSFVNAVSLGITSYRFAAFQDNAAPPLQQASITTTYRLVWP